MDSGMFHFYRMAAMYCMRRFKYKAGMKEYLPKGSLGGVEFQDWLAKRIESGEPFMVARFGSQEARATAWSYSVRHGFARSVPKYVWGRIENLSGFFPADSENITQFGAVMEDAASCLD